jgi:hypothetical protein
MNDGDGRYRVRRHSASFARADAEPRFSALYSPPTLAHTGLRSPSGCSLAAR